MSWRKLAPHIYSAAKVTATGASITLGSTVFSCYLAIKVEAAGHRTLFAFFPHWYANVEHANGIDPELLASARIMYGGQERQLKSKTLQQQMAKEKEGTDSKTEDPTKDPTKTVFTIESFMDPAVKRVQELSTLDLDSCAMTA